MKLEGMFSALRRVIPALVASSLLATSFVVMPVTSQPAVADGSQSTIDYAARFNGTTQYASRSGGVLPPTSDFTVSAWIREDAGTTGIRNILSQGVLASSNASFELRLDGAANDRRVVIYRAFGSGASPFITSNVVVPQGRWVHLAVSYNHTAQTHTIFMDGQLAQVWSNSPNAVAFTGNFFVGLNYFTNAEFFRGLIDEVTIWNGTRDSTAIQSFMHSKLAGTESGLVGYWDFNAASTTVFDRTANARNLTMVGAGAYEDVKTTTASGNSTILVFPRTYLPGGGLWTPPSGLRTVSALVVGGGGGGAGNYTPVLAGAGGSGGGGGVYVASGLPTSSAIAIVVGQGGRGGNPSSTNAGASGFQGQTSRIGALTAGGGGGGGCEVVSDPCAPSATIHGLPGTASGSGGSPSNFYNAYSRGSAGLATAVTISGVTLAARSGFQGGIYNEGGTSVLNSAASAGGAGSAGTRNSPGAGVNSPITGTTVEYGAGGASWNSSSFSMALPAPNTGKGGSGARELSGATRGVSGSSGIVVLSYSSLVPTPENVTVSPTAGGLTVTWSAVTGTDWEVSYRVEYALTTSSNTWTTSTASTASTSHSITGLDPSKSYYVRVAAVTSQGTTPWAYPWTKIFQTASPSRDNNGQIVYEAGVGLSGNSTTLTRTDYSRVRYRVEANPTGVARTMDVNFAKTLTNKNSSANPSEDYTDLFRLQMPVDVGGTNSQFEIHGTVSDLTFTSSASTGLGSGSGLTARLEIWPWNYAGDPATGLSGGTMATNFDDGDSYSSSGNYGSFQIHVLSGGASPLIAWNRQWNGANKTEVGFGPQPQTGLNNWNPDWTFAADDTNYSGPTSFLWQSFANLSVTPLALTVTYNYNGATGGNSTASAPFTSTPVTLPTPTKTGELFGGWYTDSNFTTFVGRGGAAYSPSANITLVARWTDLVVNLDGMDPLSLTNNGAAWTSSPPANSNATSAGLTGQTAYFSEGSVEGFDFDNSGDAVHFAAGTGRVTGAMTFESWIKPEGTFQDGWNIFATRWFSSTSGSESATSKDWHLGVFQRNGVPRLNLYTTGTLSTSFSGTGLESDFVFPSNAGSSPVWYHVAFTIDSSGTARLYVNGLLSGTFANQPNTPSSTALLIIGDSRVSKGMEGKVSKVQIRNRALSDSELLSSYNTHSSTFGLPQVTVQPTNDYSLTLAGTSRAGARVGSSASSVQVIPNDQSFTMETWIKPESRSGAFQVTLMDNVSGSDLEGRTYLRLDDYGSGAMLVAGYDDQTAGLDGALATTSTGVVSYGKWQHLAVTVERAGAAVGNCSGTGSITMTIYVDGVQRSQNTDASFNGCLDSDGLSVGDFGNDLSIDNNKFAKGSFDQVKIWDGALTAAEVQASMAAYARGTVDNTLRAHYSFNELGASPVSGNAVLNLASTGASYDLALYSPTPSNVAANAGRSLNSFSVTYDGNSPTSGSVASASTTPYRSVTIASQGNLLKTNNQFNGWHTTASGTGGTDYAAGDIYQMSYANLDLHAKWTVTIQSVTPTVTYPSATFSAGGTNSPTVNANGHDGTPTFTSNSLSICTVNSSTGVASLVQVGTCSITASYPLTANYTAVAVTSTFAVQVANQQALVWNQSRTEMGYLGSLDLSGIISGGNGTGAISFSATGCTLTLDVLSGGVPGTTCTVVATKGADVNYNSASVTQVITVNKINQAALSVANPGTVRFGDTIQAASVGGSGTGAVTFNSTSSAVCTETVTEGEFEIIGVGDCVITVSKAADSNYNIQSGSRTVATTKASHTLSFTSAIPANPIATGSYSISAVSSTNFGSLAPSFRVVAGSSSICSISGATVSFLLDGVCEIEAFKDATTNYLAAQTISQRIVVGQANQTITFAALANKTFGDPAFTVSATTSSNNPVTFSSGSGTTNGSCSVTSGGLVVVSAVGTCEVVAQSASGNGYAAASPISRSFSVVADTAGAPFITAVSFGDQSLTATYFAPSYLGGGTISGYRLQAFAGSTLVATSSSCATSGTLSCTISGLTNGTSYTLKIAAVTEAGLGAISPASSAMTPAATPAAVSALTAAQGDQKLTLTWRAPSNLGGGSLDSFRVYHRLAGGSYPNTYITLTASQATAATTAGVTSLEITGLINGQAYDVKVITVTTANLANLTSATTEVTQTPYTVPDAPLSVTVLDMPNDIVITWSQPVFDGGSAIDGYSVLLDSVAATCSATSATSCTIPKNTLTPGTTINIGVKAENDAGYSTPANTTFTVAGSVVVNPPVITTPINPGQGPATGLKPVEGMDWAWTKRLGNNKVKVYIKFPEMGSNYQINLQKNDGDFRRVMSKTINTTSDTDLLLVGTSYYLVRTIDLPGEGRYRIEVTVDGERMLLNGRDRPAVFSYR